MKVTWACSCDSCPAFVASGSTRWNIFLASVIHYVSGLQVKDSERSIKAECSLPTWRMKNYSANYKGTEWAMTCERWTYPPLMRVSFVSIPIFNFKNCACNAYYLDTVRGKVSDRWGCRIPPSPQMRLALYCPRQQEWNGSVIYLWCQY